MSRRKTRAFEQRVYERGRKRDQEGVAAEEWLHPETVRDIFRRWATRYSSTPRRAAVGVMGIDEMSLRRRHRQYMLVISDIARCYVIAVLAERNKETLEQWLGELPESHKALVKQVSIDLWEPYRQAVRTALPHARIVADRFHLMRQLNDRLSQLRRALQRDAGTERRAVLQGSRWILMKNRAELSDQEEQKLREILGRVPEPARVYVLKEEFRAICEKLTDRSRAAVFLQRWIWKAEALENWYLDRFLSTLQNWWQEFLNYFVEGVTNGSVEGINRSDSSHDSAGLWLSGLRELSPPSHRGVRLTRILPTDLGRAIIY